MQKDDFIKLRTRLAKTQKGLAELLGVSIKTLQSYEQGSRKIPAHAERQLIFLISRSRDTVGPLKPCWTIKKCPTARKIKCPAWEFQAGKLCWFINGTICECASKKDWRAKMKVCKKCNVLRSFLELD